MEDKAPVYILYVPDMAKKMNKTHAAIRAAVSRGSESVPKPFKLGQKWAWVEADVDSFIKQKKSEAEK